MSGSTWGGGGSWGGLCGGGGAGGGGPRGGRGGGGLAAALRYFGGGGGGGIDWPRPSSGNSVTAAHPAAPGRHACVVGATCRFCTIVRSAWSVYGPSVLPSMGSDQRGEAEGALGGGGGG